MIILGRVLFGLTVSGWLGLLCFFMCYWGKLFSVGLVDQLFQPALHQVETVRKAFA